MIDEVRFDIPGAIITWSECKGRPFWGLKPVTNAVFKMYRLGKLRIFVYRLSYLKQVKRGRQR